MSARSSIPIPSTRAIGHGFFVLLLILLTLPTYAAEVIPPAPKHYFNDYANVISPQVARQLDQTLEAFERQTSNQIVVVIYPKMQSDSSIEDYTVRVAHKWGIGQKGKDNGAALFVFTQDHTLFLQVGYGLEGALPDALAKQIIDTEITPRFRNGDFDGGVTAGVNAILAATRGEYKGTGRIASQQHLSPSSLPINPAFLFFGFFFLVMLMSLYQRIRMGRVYHRDGWRSTWSPPIIWGGGWGSGGGGGGGGFSGGGGGFGGGGAGGRW